MEEFRAINTSRKILMLVSLQELMKCVTWKGLIIINAMAEWFIGLPRRSRQVWNSDPGLALSI